MRWLERLYVVALALLVGAQCAVGYLVAPLLFAMLPERALAGSVAGALFTRLGWIALLLLPLLIVLHGGLAGAVLPGRQPARALWWERAGLFAMLVLTAIGHLWLRPAIAEVRAAVQAGGGFDAASAELRARFATLHGVSSVVFLLTTLAGIALLARLGTRSSSGG